VTIGVMKIAITATTPTAKQTMAALSRPLRGEAGDGETEESEE
jgi:hypothetical protein